MKFNMLAHVQQTLRKRLCEYRYSRLLDQSSTSVHINAIEIALGLVDYAVEQKRPIQKEEEIWFDAGIHIYRLLESSEWEDLTALYAHLVAETKKNGFFRG